MAAAAAAAAAAARMRGRRKAAGGGGDDDKVDQSEVRWLISYSDYMMQLVVLFILLFAASSVSEEKLRAITSAMAEALHGHVNRRHANVSDAKPPRDAFLPAVSRVIADLEERAKRYGHETERPDVETTPLKEGIKVSVRDAVFAEGSAEVSAAAQKVLLEVAAILRLYPTRIEVRGHTADAPADSVNGDAWLLAYRRAEAVHRILLGKPDDPVSGDKRRFRITACAYNEPAPPDPSASVRDGRADRRVEIVVTEERMGDAAGGAPGR